MRKPVALLSVYNKTGIVEFAKELSELGFKLISSGGTASKLKETGIPVTDVAEISGFPPILGHRVVTLIPAIHAGLLAAEDQLQELEQLGYPKIDLVCVDLYPLQEEIDRPGATRESVIEKTDIGGPTMLRSGAKGRRIVVCDPVDRMRVIAWLKEGKPEEEAFITKLAAKAEGVVAEYCLASARYHSEENIDGMIGTKVAMNLKYGENPYLKARLYKTNENPLGVPAFEQIGGTEPSLVNLTDIDRLARTMVQISATFKLNFGKVPCIAIGVKHGNACGAAVGMHPTIAIKKMLDGDPIAIFGGMIMTNFAIEEDIATLLRTYGMPEGKKRLLDGVIAPEFSEETSEILERKHQKCRMFKNPHLSLVSKEELPCRQYRRIGGGLIRQDGYPYILDLQDTRMEKNGIEVEPQKQRDLALASAIGSTSVSNSMTLVKNDMLIGNGVGQQARVRAARLAIMIAGEGKHDLKGASAYSDSYFPEPDGPIVLAEAGIKAIFASSGSIKDETVRKTCTEYGVALWQLPDALCRGFFHH